MTLDEPEHRPYGSIEENEVKLTKGEAKALVLFASGLDDCSIAGKLRVSYTTTVQMLKFVQRKLKASSRSQAVEIAAKLKLIKLP